MPGRQAPFTLKYFAILYHVILSEAVASKPFSVSVKNYIISYEKSHLLQLDFSNKL